MHQHYSACWTRPSCSHMQRLCFSGGHFEVSLFTYHNAEIFCVTMIFFFLCSGFIAERVNLRYFLSLGMLASGISCYLFGIAKSYNIHSLWYFIVVQVNIRLIKHIDAYIFMWFSSFFFFYITGNRRNLSNFWLARCGNSCGKLVRKREARLDLWSVELSYIFRKYIRHFNCGRVRRVRLESEFHSARSDNGCNGVSPLSVLSAKSCRHRI